MWWLEAVIVGRSVGGMWGQVPILWPVSCLRTPTQNLSTKQSGQQANQDQRLWLGALMGLSGEKKIIKIDIWIFIRWWDIRNFEKAKEEFIVDVENKDPKSLGSYIWYTLRDWLSIIFKGDKEKALTVSCLEYEHTIPAKFMIGTDQGVALGCSRKAKCQAEYILSSFEAHYGPIRSLQRNPCYTKVKLFICFSLF